MSSSENTQKGRDGILRLATLAITGLVLAACATDGGDAPMEGIGFREARFQQISTMREYRECRDQGIELDRQARTRGSAGTYLTSAKVLEKCEASVGADGSGLAQNERMQAYALSIQNYFKGGDVAHARDNLDQFKKRFPGHDLYYPDGTSFIVTMEALLGRRASWTFGEFAALNVNGTLKAEMRRMTYWKTR